MLKRERIPVVAAAVLAIIVLILAFALQPTFGSWSARVTNGSNTAGTAAGQRMRTCYDEMKETTDAYGGYLYHFQAPYSLSTNDSLDKTTWQATNGQVIQPNQSWNYSDASQAVTEPCVGETKHAYFRGGNATEGGAIQSGLSSTRTTMNVTSTPVTMPTQFTTETWINTSDAQGTIVVNSIFGNYDRPVWRVQVMTDGTVAFQVRKAPLGVDRVYDQVKSATHVNDGEWHQVVTTWNFRTKEMGIFVDGQQEAQKISKSDLYRFTGESEGYIRYGYTGGNNNWPENSPDNFLGYMSFAAVYPTILSQADVKLHWEARNGVMGWPTK